MSDVFVVLLLIYHTEYSHGLHYKAQRIKLLVMWAPFVVTATFIVVEGERGAILIVTSVLWRDD
jgi:SUMO ligase MMS21 Smc5/6 complex component